MKRRALVPELMATDIGGSLASWCGPCGFSVLCGRPEDGFARIERDGSRLVPDGLPEDRRGG